MRWIKERKGGKGKLKDGQHWLMSPCTSFWHAALIAEPASADIAEGIDAIVALAFGWVRCRGAEIAKYI